MSKSDDEEAHRTWAKLARAATTSALPDKLDPPAPEKKPRITYGSCIHPKAQTFGMKSQQYLWTEEQSITKEDLFEAIEHWGLSPPNLILDIAGPAAAGLFYQEALDNPALQDHVSEAWELLKATAENKDEVTIENVKQHISDELEMRIIDMLKSLLAACEQTNSWISISSGGRNYADYLLERALANCNSRPVIITCLAPTWYTNTGLNQSTVWDLLKDKAEGVKNHRTSASWKEGKLQIPSEVIEVPIELGNTYSRDWPVEWATHYFFIHDPTWIRGFNKNWLGINGTFYISGGGGCAYDIANAIKDRVPTVLVKHSGRTSNFYSFAIEAIIALTKNFTLPPKDLKPPEVINKMKEINGDFFYHDDGSIYGCVQPNSASMYITMLVEACISDPRLFQRSVVVLDGFKATQKQTLNNLSRCFANSDADVCALDVAGSSADTEAINKTWELHDMLESNCEVFSWRVNILTLLGLILAMTTTTISVCLTYLETESVAKTKWASKVLETSYYGCATYALVLFPAIGGMATQFLSRFHFAMKWGALYMVKTQVESEIYMFATQCGPYNARQPKNKSKNEKDSADQAAQTNKADPNLTPFQMRQLFTQRVTDLHGSVLALLYSDALHPPSREALLYTDSAAEELLLSGKSPLAKYGAVEQDLEAADSPVMKNIAARLFAPEVASALKDSRLQTHIGGEEYYELRVLPLLNRYKTLAPKMAQRYYVYEVLLVISSLCSTLLAALSMNVWVPMTIAVSGMLSGFLSHESLGGQLFALNAGIADLTMLTTKWAAAGAVEKRTQSMKTFMVEIVENCCVRTATAYVAGSAYAGKLKSTEEKQDEEGQDAKAENDKTKLGKKQ
jgi:hypothetical protein